MKTYFFNSLLDVNTDILKQLDIKCILLDIDNTIKPYGATEISKPYVDWINKVKAANIKVILCSNNYKRNVAPIANLINCNFVFFCLKPSPIGYLRAYVKSKTKHKNIIVIGDQFFTDILGGKFLFFKTFLLNPISEDSEGTTVKLRRKLTSAFTNRIKNRDNPYIKGSR